MFCVSGNNLIKFINADIFENSPNLVIIDLAGNICIEGVFSRQRLNQTLRAKCQQQTLTIESRKLSSLSCGEIISAEEGGVATPEGGIIYGGTEIESEETSEKKEKRIYGAL